MSAKKFNHVGHLLCLAFGVKSCQVLRIEAHYSKGITLDAIVLTTPKRKTAGGRILRRRVKRVLPNKYGWATRRLRALLK